MKKLLKVSKPASIILGAITAIVVFAVNVSQAVTWFKSSKEDKLKILGGDD